MIYVVGTLVLVLAMVLLVWWLFARKMRANPVTDVAALSPPGGTMTPLEWQHVAPDPGLLYRFRGGPLSVGGMKGFQRVNATAVTSFRGRRVVAFLYTYRKISVLYRPMYAQGYTIVSVDLPAPMPTLEIARRGLPATPGNPTRLGDSAFDQSFQVIADDPRFAQAVLGPHVVRWLMTDRRAGSLPIRIEGPTMSTWSHDLFTPSDRVLRPELVAPMADYLLRFLELAWPRDAPGVTGLPRT